MDKQKIIADLKEASGEKVLINQNQICRALSIGKPKAEWLMEGYDFTRGLGRGHAKRYSIRDVADAICRKG